MNEIENNLLLGKCIEEIKLLFPTFTFGSHFASSYNGEISSSEFEFAIHQESLIGTPYDIVNEKEFIHYTNLDSLINILNNQNLRLFNLSNMYDNEEFDFLIKSLDLKITDKEINDFKRKIFISSMCKYADGFEDFNLWRLYGDNGKGVGIVFELMNEIKIGNSFY